MSAYIEYGVKLTRGQKAKLASAIKNNSPLTLRLKHSHLRGSDELMLTHRQITKIKKAISNGTGSDIKISKTQIRKAVKHGGSLVSSLASLGAKILPFALKGASKLAPAIATGAATALGDIGIKKLFGGKLPTIEIPQKFIKLLPPYRKEFTKSQRDRVNTSYQTGGKLTIKPTAKQIEGGFLGTLVSIGIPMAISLVSKMLGSGLQVDRGVSTNTRNIYVPPVGIAPPPPHPPATGKGHQPPPFYGMWPETPMIGMRGGSASPQNPPAKKKRQKREKEYCSEKTARSTQCPFWAPFCN